MSFLLDTDTASAFCAARLECLAVSCNIVVVYIYINLVGC